MLCTIILFRALTLGFWSPFRNIIQSFFYIVYFSISVVLLEVHISLEESYIRIQHLDIFRTVKLDF